MSGTKSVGSSLTVTEKLCLHFAHSCCDDDDAMIEGILPRKGGGRGGG